MGKSGSSTTSDEGLLEMNSDKKKHSKSHIIEEIPVSEKKKKKKDKEDKSAPNASVIELQSSPATADIVLNDKTKKKKSKKDTTEKRSDEDSSVALQDKNKGRKGGAKMDAQSSSSQRMAEAPTMDDDSRKGGCDDQHEKKDSSVENSLTNEVLAAPAKMDLLLSGKKKKKSKKDRSKEDRAPARSVDECLLAVQDEKVMSGGKKTDDKKRKRKGSNEDTAAAGPVEEDEKLTCQKRDKKKGRKGETKTGVLASSSQPVAETASVEIDSERASTQQMGSDGQKAVTKTLFVGHVPYHATVEQLEKWFKDHGFQTVDCIVPCYDGCPRGFAYVEFPAPQDAEEALDVLRNVKFLDKEVTLALSYEDTCKMRAMYLLNKWGERRSVLIKGLDISVGEDVIRKSLQLHFTRCKIINISFKKGADGMVILDLKDYDSFTAAMELDGSILDGRTIQVNEVKPPGPGEKFVCTSCCGTGLYCVQCGRCIGGRFQSNNSFRSFHHQSPELGVVVKWMWRQRQQMGSEEQMEVDLKAHFGTYGELASISVQPEKCMAFLYYKDKESATKALGSKTVNLGTRSFWVEQKRSRTATA